MTKNPQDSSITEYAAITSQYGYVTNDNVTTNLVATLNNTVSGANGTSTVNYGYTYDANGRITQITAASAISGMSGTSTYTYDEAGQLVREVSGNTTEYAYDSKGNISSRKVYSGETLVSTDTFIYGTELWEDRLTSYNGNAITYDSIGNPTSYLGATLSWRGRELTSYTKGNKQISYSYDVDGMRYKKTVTENDSVTATYDYVYSDGTLILLTYTANGVANTARFIYDSWGEPRGFMLNDTAVYLYIKNAQGDITGIVDESGNVLLAYSYTAWGNVTYSATNMENLALAVTLSNVNPFTYRGYCYDYDIGMYYLQSRYYDPTICRFINADSTDFLGATGTLLSYNLFAYCENDGVNRVDPRGNAYISITSTYLLLETNMYFINTEICYVNNDATTKRWGSMFYLFEDNIIKISTSVPGLWHIINKKRLYYFARGVLYCARYLNKDSLCGRTIKGIQFEILIHYIMYMGLKDKENRTDQENKDFKRVSLIDIGASSKVNGKKIGYDSNAATFEKYKKYYSFFETKLFSNKYTAYALYKLAYSLGLT